MGSSAKKFRRNERSRHQIEFALGQLAVDHVIPFALWGNNDLWNLLPADARVNGQKSDKLPTADLLIERRPEVFHRWAMLRDAVPAAFDLHASNLLGRRPGRPPAWESDLLGCLRQAVELTALQRGIERWKPTIVTAAPAR